MGAYAVWLNPTAISCLATALPESPLPQLVNRWFGRRWLGVCFITSSFRLCLLLIHLLFPPVMLKLNKASIPVSLFPYNGRPFSCGRPFCLLCLLVVRINAFHGVIANQNLMIGLFGMHLCYCLVHHDQIRRFFIKCQKVEYCFD